MGAWLEAYEELDDEQKLRVQRWLHLNKFIARTLKLDWDEWIDDYVKSCVENPLDYAFMQACLPGFTGIDTQGQGTTFSTEVDPATAAVAKVPLRAQNNLGRLSPDLQDTLAAMLETGEPDPAKVSPADVTALQKILRTEKTLAKLKRPLFRKVQVARDEDDIVLRVEGGDELVRMNVLEFGAVMRKQNV